MRKVLKALSFGNFLRLLSALLTIAVCLFIAGGIIVYFVTKPVEPPTLQEAPWTIQTFSNDKFRIPDRVYYAHEVDVLTNGTAVATGYWTYDGQNFHKHDGAIQFPFAVYGKITIDRRIK